MKNITLLSAILISAFVIQLSFGAPSLTITKPPVTPGVSWTGPSSPTYPINDPHATNGQWFLDPQSGNYDYRTHEFHDNIVGSGGGFAGFFAIYGYVSAITYVAGPGTPIAAFDITATISNDIPALSAWLSGNNSHGEQRIFTNMADQKFEGTLLDVKLTAEFSIDPNPPAPPLPPIGPPYFDPNSEVHIEAINNQQLAWYCWTPENPQDLQPWGGFHVPTWDFGNIPLGAGVTKIMRFNVNAPMPATDPRYLVIDGSFQTGDDIFLNRTTSLKISDWIESIYGDNGTAYPGQGEEGHSSDVSVFHNIPEPGIFAGLLLGIFALFRKFTK